MSQKLPKLSEGLRCGSLTVKLAQTEAEKHKAYKLRYEVFNEELNEGIPENEKIGMDIDPFDPICDHLLVVSKDEVVGTYRLLLGKNKPEAGFYTETEFDLSEFNIDFSRSIELGRACIKKEYRGKKTLMALLWGLDHFMMDNNSRYLFGCSSLPKMSEVDAAATYCELRKQGKIDASLNVRPLANNVNIDKHAEGNSVIPALMAIYLEFGARVVGKPTYDPIFGCHDFFVYIDRERLSEWAKLFLVKFDSRALRSQSEN